MIDASTTATAGSNIEGWQQIGELALAFGLSAVIGLEREIKQKSAGLRTHTLVGVGAALFMLVSKYGFTDVLEANRVILDPSRMAAQIVSGIGFLGAGIIFVRQDSVRGLTTAASIWVTAAIGAAAGAGLPILAVVGTAIYGLVALAFTAVSHRLPRSSYAESVVRVRYPDGKGMLRQLLSITTASGFAIDETTTKVEDGSVELMMHVHGRSSPHDLISRLVDSAGVDNVRLDDPNAVDD
ncbi:MAG TPA: MgtC/SapB family protein [Mycobacteriales bacterium]|nr:MgtC/SapB family protein [Mycobacteriales bacterium]